MTFTVLKTLTRSKQSHAVHVEDNDFHRVEDTLTRSKQNRTVHVEDNDFHRAEDTHQEQTEPRSACRRQ